MKRALAWWPWSAVFLLATSDLAASAAPELSASEIASRALENNAFSATNARAEVGLEVVREGKAIRRRHILTKIKRDPEWVRSFVEFVGPADVAGTKFLSKEHRGRDSEQFIYLPAFKKVKRVVGADRASSFMGTDFSYADLDGRYVDSAVWTRLPDAALGEQACYVVEGIPKAAEAERAASGTYGRTIMWVHRQHLIPMRMDFFDPEGKTVAKRLAVRKLERRNDRWIATESTMATLAKGTETRLRVESVDFDTAISDDDFSQRALER